MNIKEILEAITEGFRRASDTETLEDYIKLVKELTDKPIEEAAIIMKIVVRNPSFATHYRELLIHSAWKTFAKKVGPSILSK